ncbi:prephenate dehydratase [Parasulfuritortus cantonensis]|uniref:Bifunctional chorismate mutase/prephenate dehydratase n=1 Tax=Parasulfuritortus cantonensis TaxID=2528202 RepID=A0A4V2NV11_9PROT|nr:prephenate dehydratase [Parasulfuritortus cantonensis]TCJ11726.1 prephenate dehydratase [Parasulfuritortus cantonensis]
MNEELAKLREQIDALDERVLVLLNERARLAQAVGHLKLSNGEEGGPIYRPEREAQVVRRLQAANAGPLPGEAIERLFKEVMSACRALEQPLTVAYLGPAGTFSEEAAVKQFGQSTHGLPVASFDEVFKTVEADLAEFGVVPVENTTEGAIGRTLDLLLATPLTVCGEVAVRVRQNLLRKVGGLAGIRVVYSHAQSLGQCAGWLNAYLPQAERVAVASNAEAARLAAESEDAAAIAGERAAEVYGLAIAAPGIEDVAGNTTRFLVLGKDAAPPSGKDKTSLAVYVRNKPGALLELIEPFARLGVGLCKLESRPAKSGNWEYVFFIDLEGHREEPLVAEAIQEAARHALSVKVLGSYPTAL